MLIYIFFIYSLLKMRENREVRTAGPWFNGLAEIKENSETSKTVERGPLS